MRNHPLGIYEKALAKDLSWPERLVLAKSCGFDFVEMSVDETDERLSRLDWSAAQRTSLVAAMIENRCWDPVDVPVRTSSLSLW
ncbi:L-xylulose 5-phosphate 3-epimerase [Escherichia coli]|nr:L-xylulose 5-phosphate 3-epimerase [Escherichia coli]